MLDDFLEAQDRIPTEAEYEQLVERFRSEDCPICESQESPLNAFKVTTVQSFIFWTRSEKEVVLGCPDCIVRAATKARIKTLLFGWWGFPWGIPATIVGFFQTRKALRAHQFPEPTPELLGLVGRNRVPMMARLILEERLLKEEARERGDLSVSEGDESERVYTVLQAPAGCGAQTAGLEEFSTTVKLEPGEIVTYFRSYSDVAERILRQSHGERSMPSTFLREVGGGYRVGWFDDAEGHVQDWDDLAEAAADYLLFSFGRGRLGVTWAVRTGN
ncbi:MAG: hypothetical protein SX243_16320 [Acidobacteriota bacterium]|nr:hypothetical protein [Acidobacteriota bacterium]